MMLFCGDPHGQFGHIHEAAKRYPGVPLVMLGDIQAKRPLHEELDALPSPVWFIHGNHDTDNDSDYDNLFHSELADRNLHGRVVDIAGRRVAGLGGVFRGQVWLPPETPLFASSNDFLMRCGKGNHWRGGLPRKHRSSIFPDHYDQLVAEACDIIVSHEAPFGHRYGFSALNELAGAMGARLIVHGHHHENLDYPETDGLRAMGVGYRCIRDDKGNLVFDGSHFIASERA